MEKKTVEQLDQEISNQLIQMTSEQYAGKSTSTAQVVALQALKAEQDAAVSLNEMEVLEDYDPDKLDAEAFKKRYAGMYQKDTGKRLSKSSMRGIWRRFMSHEQHAFFEAHKNLSLYDIARVGIDKFIYTMGWRSKADTKRWRNNKVRIGVCCHCQDQFIPMMFQHNHGLCRNCKPLYSSKAMRNFVLNQLQTAERYQHAHRDALMDFYIMFYHDARLRNLFLKDSDYAKEFEVMDLQPPEWLQKESGWEPDEPIDVEGGVVEDDRDLT